jgi:hypothetical protein
MLMIENTTGMSLLKILSASQGHSHKYEDLKKGNIQLQFQLLFFSKKST